MTCDRKIGPFDCCSVVQGDCLLLMRDLPDGCVDAVITDPPYGISYVKGKGGGDGKYRGRVSAAESRHHEAIVGDNRPFDPVPLLRFGNVLMWGANHYCHRLPEGVGRWLAWNKLADIESFDSFSDVEFAWHSQGRASRILNYMWKGGLACVKAGEDNGRRSHPTQKPIGLMAWCIEQAGTPDTILDPFCGSGTTLVAARKLGRHYLGFEISETYCQIARRRIAEVEAQPNLFEPKPEQLTL